MTDEARKFRKAWSHPPTAIPQNASGLWYSEECTDQLCAEFAASCLAEKEREMAELRTQIVDLKAKVIGMGKFSEALEEENAKPKVEAESVPSASTSAQLANLLCNVAQILDVVKQEWGESWSRWDQSIRDEISKELQGLYEPSVPSPSTEKGAREWLRDWMKIQPRAPKPTIEELQAILYAPETGEILMAPDGSISVGPPEWAVNALDAYAASLREKNAKLLALLKSREDEIERLKVENKNLDERHVRFLVQGGPVVMASDYDKLKIRISELESELDAERRRMDEKI